MVSSDFIPFKLSSYFHIYLFLPNDFAFSHLNSSHKYFYVYFIPMANNNRFSIEKVAFCSVLCAGFAYAGYNVVRKVYSKKTKKKESKLSQSMLICKRKNLNYALNAILLFSKSNLCFYRPHELSNN